MFDPKVPRDQLLYPRMQRPDETVMRSPNLKDLTCRDLRYSELHRERTPGGTASQFTLRQVVTNRSPEHMVDSPGVAAGIGRPAGARPQIALQAAVLDAHPEAALRTIVEVVPEAGNALLDILIVGCASAGKAGNKASTRKTFHVAAGHVDGG